MEFGKRAAGARQPFASAQDRSLHADNLSASDHDPSPLKGGNPRVRFAATAILGLVIGFGGVAAGTTFVHASERAGLFDIFNLFSAPPPPAPVARGHSPRRYSSLPDARRVSTTRWREYTPRPFAEGYRPRRNGYGSFAGSQSYGGSLPIASAGRGQQTVCVRTCDGYKFPLGRLASSRDIPVHQAACAAACPNAQTALFTLPNGHAELDQAVSLKGQPYLAAAWANVYRQKRVQNCSCQPVGVSAAPLAIGSDPTIRVGDVLSTDDSAQVVTRLVHGHVQVADYRRARGLSRSARRDIDRQVGALRREVADAEFRRALRAADAATVRVRIAEVGTDRLPLSVAGKSFTDISAPKGGSQNFTPVRVVSPSIYRP